jgi:hypothetical protein
MNVEIATPDRQGELLGTDRPRGAAAVIACSAKLGPS